MRSCSTFGGVCGDSRENVGLRSTDLGLRATISSASPPLSSSRGIVCDRSANSGLPYLPYSRPPVQSTSHQPTVLSTINACICRGTSSSNDRITSFHPNCDCRRRYHQLQCSYKRAADASQQYQRDHQQQCLSAPRSPTQQWLAPPPVPYVAHTSSSPEAVR